MLKEIWQKIRNNILTASYEHILVQGKASFPPRHLKTILTSLLNILQENKLFIFDSPKLELILVHDKEIMNYNHKYLSCYGPTNILSFPSAEYSYNDFNNKNNIVNVVSELGTLILSVDTLAREAKLYGQSPDIHLVRLLIHGLLHLLGFEHGEKMDSLADLLEEKILKL